MHYRLILLWLLLSVGAGQASTLKGVVLANKEGGSAVPDVDVGAKGANVTKTGDVTGSFVLIFPDKRPGETVQIVIGKPGYAAWTDTVVSNSNDVAITLHKK